MLRLALWRYVIRPLAFLGWILFRLFTKPFGFKPIEWFEVRETTAERLLPPNT